MKSFRPFSKFYYFFVLFFFFFFANEYAFAQTVKVSGNITSNAAGLPGVNVNITGGVTNLNQNTDANGYYEFFVPPNMGYTITPTLANYTFAPAAITLTAAQTIVDVAFQNFTGTAAALPPTITSINPTSGLETGFTSVTIMGTNFAPGATVTFGGSPATNVTMTPPTLINCSTPVHAPGPVEVRVTNPNNQFGSMANGFTYTAAAQAPIITNVTPNNGPASGGTSVTITGNNFIAGATVKFNAMSATGVTVTPPNTITCITPANTPGPVMVEVTNPGGLFGSLPNGFTYTQTNIKVSGNITSNAVGLPGVNVNITGGVTNFNQNTDANGYYEFFVPPNMGYTITPTLTNYTFAPAAITLTAAQTIADVAFQNFTGTPVALPPTITSINPPSGIETGFTLVTIMGTNFATGATVTFGGSPATNVTVTPPNQITCNTPVHAPGPVDVMVTNLNSQFGTMANGYTYSAVALPPTITSINPTSGLETGLTSVTIMGTNFESGATVTFGGSPATNVTMTPPTLINCSTPVHAPGPVEVRVTNPNNQFGSMANGFTYTAAAQAPTITNVTPNNGPASGGTSVTITGNNFIAGATVKFNAMSATGVTVTPPNTITCLTPANTPGPVMVEVTNPGGLFGSLPNGFTYTQTNIKVSGNITSNAVGLPGVNVNISGGAANFNQITDANGYYEFFVPPNMGYTITPTLANYTFAPAAITLTAAQTIADVAFQNFTGTSAALPPTITSINPTSGSETGFTSVTIMGTNFVSGATVTFGGSPATNVTMTPPTLINCSTPVHAPGPVEVRVTNPNNQFGSMANGFTYTAAAQAPTITNVTPNNGPASGGTSVTITGNNFMVGATVKFNAMSATAVTVTPPNTITCLTPANTPGPVMVEVTNPGGLFGSLPNGFTYTQTNIKVSGNITSAAIGLPGVNVNITGGVTNLNHVTDANGYYEFFVPPNMGYTLTPTLANYIFTPATITLTAGQTIADVAFQNFTGTVAALPPTITSINPTSGIETGFTLVTIMGTNFVTGATVTFGGSPATNVIVTPPNQITCNTPVHAPGPVEVRVTNPNNQFGSMANGYTYTASAQAPTITNVTPNNGPASGGTSVTITGNNFMVGATVKFNAMSATAVTVTPPNTITCLTPANTPGPVMVEVTNPGGLFGSLPNGFTYTQTNIKVSGNITSAAIGLPGVNVNITGGVTNLNHVTDANGYYEFFVPPAMGYTITPTLANYTFTPATITITAAQTVVDVAFQNFTGTTTGGGTVPTITSITPNSGPLTGMTPVTIVGTNFVNGAIVMFGTMPATNVVWINATQLTCSTPAGISTGFVNVIVTNPTPGGSGTLPNGFNYTGGTNNIKISGNIKTTAGFGIAGVNVNLTSTSGPTNLNQLTDANGYYEFSVVPALGYMIAPTLINYTFTPSMITLTAAQTVADVPNQNFIGTTTGGGTVPTITSVTPNSGPLSGMTSVTIAGTNFVNGVTVMFGTMPATNVVWINATQLTCYTPAGISSGFVNVIVTNPIPGGSTTLPNGFNYTGGTNNIKISGNLKTTAGIGIAGINVSLTGGMNISKLTDVNGYYEFIVTPALGYTITPTPAGYTFTPAMITLTAAQTIADVPNQNFTGTAGGGNTIKISGTVRDSMNIPMIGVILNLTGDMNMSQTTDATGQYSFIVTAGKNYTVTPQLAGYAFNPPSKVYTAAMTLTDQNVQDYIGKSGGVVGNTIKISGNLKTTAGIGIAGINVSLTGGMNISKLTDANGYYEFIVTPALGYTITPTPTGYTFTPAMITLTAAQTIADVPNQNFTGTTGGGNTIKISGTVRDSMNIPMIGVILNLTGDMNMTQTTDATGQYTFIVTAGKSYTVSPQLAGYSFNPPNRIYAAAMTLTDQNAQDYIGNKGGVVGNTIKISGTVRDSMNIPMIGVILNLTGDMNMTQTTDATGQYSFIVTAGKSYTVMPQFAGYSFNPPNRIYSAAMTLTDQNAQDYIGKKGGIVGNTIKISGTVRDSINIPMIGVILNLTGDMNMTQTTDATGQYSFIVTAGKNYTVMPQFAGYSFNPPNRIYTAALTLTDQNAQDYIGNKGGVVGNTIKISGNLKTTAGIGIAGINVSLTGGMNISKLTDANGYYEFIVTPSLGYTITPTPAGYTFTPAMITLTAAQTIADVPNQNFTGTTGGGNTIKISGTVRDSINIPMIGVILNLTGDMNMTQTTDATGQYTFIVTAGKSYTVSPQLAGYSFNPPNRIYAAAMTLTDQNAQDYIGNKGGVVGNTIKISGTVRDSINIPMIGVILNLTGDMNMTQTTDATGQYTFIVTAGKSYTVSPQLAGYTFNPPNKVYTAAMTLTDQNVQDYIGKKGGVVGNTIKISGNLKTTAGIGIAGINVSLTGGMNISKLTDANGYYEFIVTPALGYTITPTPAGYAFTPAMITLTPAQTIADVPNQNFTGTTGGGNTIKISGTVRDSMNIPIIGVILNLTGDMNMTQITDATGQYSFIVTAGKNYTVTPQFAGYSFNPPSRFYTPAMTLTDQNAQDYIGKKGGVVGNTIKISGSVRDSMNIPMIGVILNLTGDVNTTQTTDATGQYSFIVTAGKSYTITPQITGYAFNPPSRFYTPAMTLTDQNAQDYIGKKGGVVGNTIKISGNLKTTAGIGIAGINVSLTGGMNISKLTDANGYYEFIVTPALGYTITPTPAGYTFTPAMITLTAAQTIADVPNQNFTGTAGGGNTIKISGTVRDSMNIPMIGVILNLTGDMNMTQTTDATGQYSFIVTVGKNYTVTPQLAGYTFNPPSKVYTAAMTLTDQNTQDYTGKKGGVGGNTIKISGAVRDSMNIPMIGVILNLTGDMNMTQTTDATGQYSFIVTAGKSYVVTPQLAGYFFNPPSRAYTPANTLTDQNTQDYTGKKGGVVGNTIKISGNLKTTAGIGIAGINVSLTGGMNISKLTDANGYYEFIVTPALGYTITPTPAGYAFTPAMITLTPAQTIADVPNQNFTGTTGGGNTIKISGTVRDSMNIPMIGVILNLTGDMNMTQTTDATGQYTFIVTAGKSYTITPQMAGYTFNPLNRIYTALLTKTDQMNQDYFGRKGGVVNTYKISGIIKDSLGIPISDVMINLTGDANLTFTTTAIGTYEFFVPGGRSYLVIPNKNGYMFQPVSRSYTPLNSDMISQDYFGKSASTLKTIKITGVVKDSLSKPLPGVMMNLSGDMVMTTSTDQNGQYILTVPANKNYYVVPSLAGFIFTPTSRQYTSANTIYDQLNQDYICKTALVTNTRKISGIIRDSLNNPIGGVNVNLSGDFSSTYFTTLNGYYEFIVASGKNYTIKPQKQGYSFSPQEKTFMQLNSDMFNLDFIGNVFKVINSYKVSGFVTDSLKKIITDVMINVTGDVSFSVPTDPTGYYEVMLQAGKNFNIIANKQNYIFNPPSYIITNLNSDKTNTSFTGKTSVLSAKISGFVKDTSGKGMSGVMLVLKTITKPDSIVWFTDQNGSFDFFVPSGFNYSLTVSKSGYIFDPQIRQFNTLTVDQINQIFTGRTTTDNKMFNISGFIRDSLNKPVMGALVNLSGQVIMSIVTDSSGSYNFMLPGGKNYTISPTKPDMIFTPPYKAFYNLGSDMKDQNFIGKSIGIVQSNFKISGYIRDSLNRGVGRIPIMLSGDANLTVVTDTTGFYVFMVSGGKNYTVTPVRGDITAFPANKSYLLLLSDMYDQNYLVRFNNIISNRKISGFVKDDQYHNIVGVNIIVKGGTIKDSMIVQTDTSGNYSLMLPAGADYNITVQKPGFKFDPPTRYYKLFNVDMTYENYVGIPIGLAMNYKISGFIRDSLNHGVSGVPVNLSGKINMMVMTDSSGFYSFNVMGGNDYMVTPSRMDLKFNPINKNYNSLNSDWQNQNYIASYLSVGTSYVISGFVKDTLNRGVIVSVNLSGGLNINQMTDSTGFYSFMIPSGQNYTVTPFRTDLIIVPTNRVYQSLNANQKDQNYIAKPIILVAPTPILAAPFNNSVKQPPTIKLEWSPVAQPVIFTLQVSKDQLFQSVDFSDTSITGNSRMVGPLANGIKYFWRVGSRYSSGMNYWSEVWNFTTIPIEFAIPGLISPTNNSTNQPSTPTLVWTYDSSATSYNLQISTNQTFSTFISNESNITKNYKQTIPLNEGIDYYWRVSAQRGAIQSQWSQSWKFTTRSITISNAPTLLFPANNTTNNPTLTKIEWSALQGVSAYEIQISGDTSFSTSLVHSSINSNSSRFVGPLTNNSTFYWRVRATNPNGEMSKWSTMWVFSTNGAAPTVPFLSSPENNSSGLPFSVELKWKIDQTVTSSRLQVSLNSLFTSDIIFDDSTITGNLKRLDNLQANSKYYWRVSAINSQGTSSWSATNKFTTKSFIAQSPNLISPTDNSTNTAIFVTLTWNSVSNIKYYYLQVSTDPNFTAIKIDDSLITSTSKDLSLLSFGTKYYWRVRSRYDLENSGWSSAWSFTTLNATLATPNPESPVANSVDQLVNLTLGWSNVNNATKYQLQVSLDPNYTQITTDTSVVNNYLPSSNLVYGAKYFWHVRAMNGLLTSDWSSTSNFATIMTVPSIPTLQSPNNNATNFPTNVNLIWNSVFGATNYQVQVTTDPGFSKIDFDLSIQSNTVQVIALKSETKYYWRVKATNSAGSSDWSTIYQFTTIFIVPDAVVLVAPSNGATNVLTTPSPSCTWIIPPGAKNVRVQVAKDPDFKNIVLDEFGLTESQYTLDNLANNSKYYWHAKAFNEGGEGQWSATWNLTTVVGRPPSPSLIIPSNDAIGVDTTVILKWTTAGDITSFSLEVSNTPDFTTNIAYQPSLNATTWKLNSLTYGTTFYWRVKSRNVFGESDWILSRFTTSAAPTEQKLWNQQNISEVSVGKINSIIPGPGGSLYAAADSGVFKSIDAGKTWNPFGTNYSSLQYASTLINTSNNDLFVSCMGGIWRIKNSETTWKKVYYTSANVILSLAANGGILGSYGQNIVISNDNGENWNLIPNLPLTSQCEAVNVVYLAQNNNIYIGTTRGANNCTDGVTEVYYTNNNGQAWVSTGFNNKDNAFGIASITMTPNGELIAGTSGFGSSPGGAYKYSQNVWSSMGLSGKKISVLVTTPNGDIYAALETETSLGFNYGRINQKEIIRSINSILDVKGGLSKSKDGGKNWEQVNDGLVDTRVSTISVTPAGQILVGTEEGGVFNTNYASENVAPYFTSSVKDTTIFKNQAVLLNISASDKNNDALVFSSQNLPTGAKFEALSSNTYTFKWTPGVNQLGNYSNITFSVSDGKLSESVAFNINVSSANSAPGFTSNIQDVSGKENIAITFTVSASDPDKDKITFRTINFPSSARLDYQTDTSMTFYWKPAFGDAGVYRDLQIIISDGFLTKSVMFSVTVKKNNRAPLAFSLKSPVPNYVIPLVYPVDNIQFKWNTSPDIDAGDIVTYKFNLIGPTSDTGGVFIGSSVPELSANIMGKLLPNSNYSWFVIATDGDLSTYSDTLKFATSTLTGTEKNNIIPKEYTLYQNYPNPFNPTTTIQFGLPKETDVSIEIYNVLGQRIRTLLYKEHYSAGTWNIVWNGKDDFGKNVSTGIYFYRMISKEFQVSKKMIMMK